MFHCQNCGVNVGPNQPTNKVVSNKRRKNYTNKKIILTPYREDIIYSEGWEIAKELNTCPKCYTSLTGREARVNEAPPKPIHLDKPKKPKKPKPWYKNDRGPEKRKPVVETINPIRVVR